MKVSIVIRTKNEQRFIGQVLEKVFSQTYREPFEVLVLDSGSTDGTVDIVGRFPVRLYRTDPRTFSYGRALNYGAVHATGEHLVHLSGHCIPGDSSWLGKLTALLEDPAVVATFGRQEPLIGINPFEELELHEIFPRDLNRPCMSIFSNSNCAIKRDLLLRYPFDEQIPFAEDFLWRKFLPEAYKTVYVPEATVFHSHPLSLRFWAKRFRAAGECVQYLDRRYGISYAWGNPHDNLGRLSKNWMAMMKREFGYFVAHGYYRFIIMIPLYEFIRTFFYMRGLKRGRRIYLPPQDRHPLSPGGERGEERGRGRVTRRWDS
ncbi:MAG: glycosyltransferase family 2 protein [Candidatus Methylomirabilaceae bacterium]